MLPVPPTPTLTSQPLKEPVTETRPSRAPTVAIRDVKRTQLPDGIRVSIEMDAESTYHAERLENPRRVFFDIKGARPSSALLDTPLKFTDDIVREIRLGRHPNTHPRRDGHGGSRQLQRVHPLRSVPARHRLQAFRGDAARACAAASIAAGDRPDAGPGAGFGRVAGHETDPDPADYRGASTVRRVGESRTASFSLSRQLGLGISRIVIDAGHGGHDPGASSNGISESELTLDVALRLSKLLENQPGVEVVMTRDTDVFIPLEERTAIANREGADLFLSIHANASRNPRAQGVETYFLNFATNPDAEAVAARENAGSAQSMNRLPAIVKAIALNNKLDESRDFAEMVQRSMVQRLSQRNRQLRDLGVKQAPFVVLIGAAMPSVLAEIAFVTNKQEGALLKTGAYRQQMAEALFAAVVRYQQSLKKIRSSAMSEPVAK